MIKTGLTKLIEAMNTATSMEDIEIIWVGDTFFVTSNYRIYLTIVFLFLTQGTTHCEVTWEKDQDTLRNYLKGRIIQRRALL